MDSMDYWRLCDELSVKQAALLIADCDPSEYEYVEKWNMEKRPKGYEAAKHALFGGLKGGQIGGELVPMAEYDINGNEVGNLAGTIEINRSFVVVESVREFLAGRGFASGFFLTRTSTAPDYLNPKHPRYAPKLSAAVQAWLAVTDAHGKHPKQALEKWLREHASNYGLSDEEGKPNETGIAEIAKVANWQMTGGAPKTPSEKSPPVTNLRAP